MPHVISGDIRGMTSKKPLPAWKLKVFAFRDAVEHRLLAISAVRHDDDGEIPSFGDVLIH